MELLISAALLLLGIAVVIAVHICIVERAFSRVYENGYVWDQRRCINGGDKRMSTEDLNKLPCFDYKEEERESTSSNPDELCVVCLENFKVGDKCRLLPNCNHRFHAPCIDPWLLKTPLCPTCRTIANPPNTHLLLKKESGVSIEVGAELV